MELKYKMHAWNSWTLVLAVVVLFIVQPSSCGTTKIGEECTVVGDCIDNTECADGSPKKCACATGFTASADKGACLKTCTAISADASSGDCSGQTGTACVIVPGKTATFVCSAACTPADCGDATKKCTYNGTTSVCLAACGNIVCDPGFSQCKGDSSGCEAKTCTADAGCTTGYKCVTASAGEAKVCGKACSSACKDTKPICVATDLTASACKACSDDKYPCPEGKECKATGKCEEPTTRQTTKTTVASPSDTTNSTKNTDNTVDTNDVMGSTTANNTNSAPGMPSAAGSLILLTCAAVLVLAAA